MGNAGRVTTVSPVNAVNTVNAVSPVSAVITVNSANSANSTNAINAASPMKGRFAPSPTGYLHLGNVWVALLSWLSVRLQGGHWVLRIEDIDTVRSKRALAEALMDDLEWLGLTWDEGPRVGGPQGPYFQSERTAYYESIINQWIATGAVYPCYCNRSRLLQIASAPHEGDTPIYYDGHCRNLTAEARQEAATRKRPSLRRAVFEPFMVTWDDVWQGSRSQVIRPEMDDFVVRRADGMFAYNLAVVADDAAMGITEIIRGYDLLEATGIQLWLYKQLGYSVPQYGHVPLLIDAAGARLSKRQHSITIRELREAGYTAEAIIGKLAAMAGLQYWTARLDSGCVPMAKHRVGMSYSGIGSKDDFPSYFEPISANALFQRLRDAGLTDLNNNDYLKDSHIRLTNFDIKV